MKDIDLVKACAKAMGIKTRVAPFRGTIMRHWYWDANVERIYDPLHDDAQCFGLLKKFNLRVLEVGSGRDWRVAIPHPIIGVICASYETDLNRAICECVAKAHKSRKL